MSTFTHQALAAALLQQLGGSVGISEQEIDDAAKAFVIDTSTRKGVVYLTLRAVPPAVTLADNPGS